jgi:hypothetical protein
MTAEVDESGPAMANAKELRHAMIRAAIATEIKLRAMP